MIRSILIVIIALGGVGLTGANNKEAESRTPVKKHCRGYSVIEVDKGIDCNGDTIKLVKMNGFFQRAVES
jgi:hypothetical protein